MWFIVCSCMYTCTHLHTHTLTHTHTHSIAGVVVVVVDVFPPQVTGANGSCAGAEEDTLINTHHNNSLTPDAFTVIQKFSDRSF